MTDVQCPNCGEACLQVSVDKGEKPVRCSNCDEEFSTEDLRLTAERLIALCTWIDSAPFRGT